MFLKPFKKLAVSVLNITSAITLKKNYSIHRKEQKNRQGGEVVAYINSDLKSKRLLDLENDEKEDLWLKLFPKRIPRPFSCIFAAGVYYPPGRSV